MSGFPSVGLPGLGLWGLYFSLSLIGHILRRARRLELGFSRLRCLGVSFPGVGLLGLIKHEVLGFSFPLLSLSGLGLHLSHLLLGLGLPGVVFPALGFPRLDNLGIRFPGYFDAFMSLSFVFLSGRKI